MQTDLENAIAERTARLVEIQRRQKLWLQQHKISYYIPRGKQPQFHASKARVRLAVGTNRSGKTTAGVVEDIALCLGFRPWQLPEELKLLPFDQLMKLFERGEIPPECLTGRSVPFKLVLIEDDWDVADELLMTGTVDKPAKLRQYLPPESLVGGSLDRQQKNGMGYICKVEFVNGSSITIDTEKSFLNDRGSFEGKSFDGAHYDEPKDRDLRVAIKRGLVDTNGIEIFTFTPIVEAWMKDELVDKAATDSEIDVFDFDARDLVKEGIISEAGWLAFVESLTEDEKEARAEGKFIHLRGLVYKEFKPSHRKDGGNLIDPLTTSWVAKNCTVWGAVDPHPRMPHGVMLMAVDREGRKIIWREVFKKCLLKDLVVMTESLLWYKPPDGEDAKIEVFRWLVDPLAWEEDPIDGHKWADEFLDLGWVVEKAPKRKEQGILNCREAFMAKDLLVCSDCTRTIYELQHYVYDDWKVKGKRNEKEKPIDKDDHMMENMYRLVLMKPEYIPQDLVLKPIKSRDLCPA